jgi:hypothetical protein
MQEEDDDVSRYLLCHTGGHLVHLTKRGTPYVPPVALDPEDVAPGNIGQHKWQWESGGHPPIINEGKSKDYSCVVSKDCTQCPLPACRFDDPGPYRAWLLEHEGKIVNTHEDVTAEVVRFGGDPSDGKERQRASQRLRRTKGREAA